MKKSILKTNIVAILIILITLLVALLQLNAATVSGVFEFGGPVEAEINKEFDVKVNVTQITGGEIGGVSGKITWDTSALQLVSSTGMSSPFSVGKLNAANKFNGFTTEYLGFSNNTTVITLRFKGLKEGNTEVTLTNPDLSDKDGNVATSSVKGNYSVRITPAKSTNAYLSSLTATGYTINFNKTTNNYTINVDNDVTSINVAATCEDPKATLTWIKGKAGSNSLVEGSNQIQPRCVAESGAYITYTLTVIRAKKDTPIVLSSDNNLNNLSVSGYSISPAFNKNTLEYSVTIPYEANDVIVNAEKSDSKATVTINGNTGLQVGDNTVEVVVVAEDGTSKTYKINVKREDKIEAPVEKDGDATLSKLNVSGYTLTPTFKPGVNVYSMTVQATVDGLKVEAIPTSSKAKVEVTGNLNWSYGMNTITITVTAENGNKNTYTVNVNRKNPTVKEEKKSNDSYLTSLTVKGGQLNPKFDKETSSYDITVPYETEKLDISYIASSDKAKVEILDNDPLLVNQKQTIRVRVTAEDGSIREYTINATRSALSSNTYLKSLTVDGFMLLPLFDKETENYKLEVKAGTKSLDLIALAENPNAKVEIFGNSDFKEGNNTVMIRVTDENGFTRIYQIDVEKPARSIFGMSLWQFLMLSLLGLGILSFFLILLVLLKRKQKEEPTPAVAAPTPAAPTIDFKPEFNFGSRNGTDDDVVYPGGILNQGNGSMEGLPGKEPKKLVGTYEEANYRNISDDDENAPFDFYDDKITKAELMAAIKEGMETKNTDKLKMLMKQEELNKLKEEVKRKESKRSGRHHDEE